MKTRQHHSEEIAALREVEKEFGVRLDYADARNWCTAGDVFAALCRSLPAELAEKPGTWERFAGALGKEIGVSASRLTPQSELVSEDGHWISVTNCSVILWLPIALAVVVGVGWLSLR